MFSKVIKVLVVTFSVFFTSYFIMVIASYFYYSDAMDKLQYLVIFIWKLATFVYYAQQSLKVWAVFNFLEVMLILVVLLIYTIFFK